MNDITYAGKHLRTYTVQKHSHISWELIYCTSGNGELIFDDFTLRYSVGDIAIIPPDIPHSNISRSGFTNIHLNISEATLPFKSAALISDDSDRHILNPFVDAFYYYYSQLDKKQIVLSALGNLIVNYLIAYRENASMSKIVETIKSNIVQNFQDCDFALDEYLHSLPFNYDYLRKLFKSEMGVTPHAYLTDMRMQTAQKLLCSIDGSGNNISKIAQMCGYSEPLYFSRVFKKQCGCSPINYAKKYRSKDN